MTSNDLSQRVSELTQRLEELQAKCVSNPEYTPEVLQDALESLQASLQELSAADKELMHFRSELQASESILRAFFDSPGVLSGIVELEEDDLRYILVNQAVADVLGLGLMPDDIEGKLISELGVPPEIVRDYVNGCKESCRLGLPVSLETHRQFPDGHRWLHVTISYQGAGPTGGPRFAYVTLDITERKRSEMALQESEERYRRLVQNTTAVILRVDPQGVIRFANERALEFFGYSLEELIGKHAVGTIVPERETTGRDLAAMVDEISKNPDRFHSNANENTRKNGERVWMEWTNSGIYDADGRLTEFLSVGIDATERRKAEQALAESEQRYRGIIETAEEGIAIHEPDGTITYVNQRMADMLGYSREEIIGGSSLDFVDDEERMAVVRARESLKDEGSFSKERKMRRKDGSILWTLANVSPRQDGAGNFLGYLAMHTDITERKRAEEKLRESEERFRAVQDNSLDRFTILKPFYDDQGEIIDFTYIYQNAQAARTAGRRPEELIGLRMSEIFPTFSQSRFFAMYKLAVETGHVTEFEDRYQADGVDDWFRATVTPIPDGIAVATQIITERKNAEEVLQKAHDELELRVQERTADLAKTNEELLKAKDAAEEAVRAKAAFLANMSHELRTPMNSIIGFTSLLLEEPLPLEYKDWLENMRMNGDALLALINDVLDFSKMEKDKIELETHPFNLRQRIEESLDLVSAKAAEKGLDLAYIMDSSVPEAIISDSARLRQVLANLLSNAVKFTDTGDVLVHVSSQPDGEGYELHFAVQDTGIGMPQDQMSKLFQPFSQINTAPSRLTEGTGLGLVISKKLVELMGGKIWAESEEGKGSAFIFTIKGKAASDDIAIKLPAGPQPQLAKRNVLIVDDNPTIRRLLGHQTKSWGMVPLVVSLSYSAIDLIQKGVTPDIAIIDVSMPDLNGITLAQTIRRYRRDLPLIILTSPGQRIPQNLPAVNLPKPIKPLQLYDALTSVSDGCPIQTQHQASTTNQTGTSPLRILLAEDNVSSQKVTIGMLKKLGYKADVAANGAEAIQALERQPYDIVLMDIKMPEMDGYEAARAIRQRWPDNGPKIVALTAYAVEGDREKCLEAGMNDYIAKPVRIEDLEIALKDISRM